MMAAENGKSWAKENDRLVQLRSSQAVEWLRVPPGFCTRGGTIKAARSVDLLKKGREVICLNVAIDRLP